MKMMRKVTSIICSLCFLLAAGCDKSNSSAPDSVNHSSVTSQESTGLGGSDSASDSTSDSGTSETPEEPEKDMTLAENYDFGDPATWAGDKVSVTDLGDAIIDTYPYDDRYDWGQSVIYDEEEGIYKMWWCRHSRYDSIWYAESEDLKHWTNAQKLIAVEENTTWLKMHVGKPSVLKMNGQYIMYFEAPATLKDGGSKEFDNNVFRATSDDGIRWSIWEGDIGEPYPVIRMTDTQMQASWNYSETGPSGYGYYGIGQPSAVYKDGTYYLYCTYSLEAGDRMYVFKSTDGIHFDAGQEVFVRAGSGVKYNTLTGKFMMAYEYTVGRLSKVYYMESDDGVKFTYANYAEASNNQNVMSTGGGFVRGYPDFVGNGMGHVNSHTVYASYMEGKMADTGNDWRQYANTWDIHFAAVNVAEFANRTKVLPNGKILNNETIAGYRDKHEPYEDRLTGISRTATPLTIDGNLDEEYANATVLNVDRVSCSECAVPGDIKAKVYVTYDDTGLYLFVEVEDGTTDPSDMVYLLFDEKRYATDPAEILNVTASRNEVVFTDGNSATVGGCRGYVKHTEKGYNVEVKLPWRYKTTLEAYDSFGFDCFVYNMRESAEYKSLITWSDYLASYNIQKAGELFFR